LRSSASMSDLSLKDVSDLSEDEARAELQRLAAALAAADIAYHQNDAPEITDAEYDTLKRRNDALEQSFPELVLLESPSGKVGAAPSEGFAKVRHGVPMLSLSNAFADEDVEDFVARAKKFFMADILREPDFKLEFTAEPKIDG